MNRNTSLSDDGQYPEFCYAASKHDEIFSNFKRHPIYNRILEHVLPEQGSAYLQVILNNSNVTFNTTQWQTFFQNDSVGNPRKVTYNIGDSQLTCSPSTLRYIKVLTDIISLFDTTKIKRVAEIGVGYAGQCRIIMNSLPIEEYNLIDLPEVLALSEKFLDKLNSNRGGYVTLTVRIFTTI